MPIGAGVGAAISAGGSLLGGILGSSAANKAAKEQEAAQQQVIQLTNQKLAEGQTRLDQAGTYSNDTSLKSMADLTGATSAGQEAAATGTTQANQTLGNAQQQELGLLQPYINSGTGALQSLATLSGDNGPLTNKFSFNPSDLQNDPGYAFTLQQGQQAIQRAAAAQGNLFSTGTLKSLAGYTTGTANQYFNDAFNRAQSTFNTNQQQALNRIGTLQGLAGYGSSATGQGVGAVSSTAGQQASNLQQGGQFGANLGVTGASDVANIGQQNVGRLAALAGTNAQLGLQGQQQISNAVIGQGNANAAGTVGSANAWLNALQGGTNNILQTLAMKGKGGSGASTGGGSSPMA